MWATFILWLRWWPATPPNWCFGDRWRSSLCCQFEQQLEVPPASKPSLSSPHTAFSAFEGIVGCRTNPEQEIRGIPGAPYLQTLITSLVFHIQVGMFKFSQGWGDCDQRSVKLVKTEAGSCKIWRTSFHGGHESHTFGSRSCITLLSLAPPSTAAQMSALSTNVVTCGDLFVFLAWIVAFSSTFF